MPRSCRFVMVSEYDATDPYANVADAAGNGTEIRVNTGACATGVTGSRRWFRDMLMVAPAVSVRVTDTPVPWIRPGCSSRGYQRDPRPSQNTSDVIDVRFSGAGNL